MRSLYCLLVAGLLLAPRLAAAHQVTVDGSAADWLARPAPPVLNLGTVARGASGGEYLWFDAAGDTRTDLSDPETLADLTAVAYTATASDLYMLVRLAGTEAGPVQVQLALDLGGAAGSGNDYLAAYADTKVAAAARWEFLVQAATSGAARLLDQSYAAVAASISAASTTSGAGTVLEIGVPWSALGLSAPPATPIRFTVASFRASADGSGTTVDVDGSTTSNALDTVSDYGLPQTGTSPNTWAEVSDLTVDFFAEVFFGPEGEVYAPLVVDSILASASAAQGSEWVSITNVSGAPIALAGWKLGTAAGIVGADGSQYAFPAGALLAPGASFVVAASGGDYFARFGRRPDAEFAVSNPDAETPDMLRFADWGPAGTWSLGEDGDEILLFDPADCLVDVAVYGSGAFAGVGSQTAGPVAGHVLGRVSGLRDTDDCAADFVDRGAACAETYECGECRLCSANSCVQEPEGTSCLGGDLCHDEGSCDAAGSCQPGAARDCDDGSACTTDSCDLGTGACIHQVLVCADDNLCTIDLCDPGLGCVNPWAEEGTICSDGNEANGEESCSEGECLSGPTPDGGMVSDAGNGPDASIDADASIGDASIDAGASTGDASIVADASTGSDASTGDASIDAGASTGSDASTVHSDASVVADAGNLDAGTAPAGQDAGVAADSAENSGCGCSAGGADASGLLALVAALGVIPVRRRRR